MKSIRRINACSLRIDYMCSFKLWYYFKVYSSYIVHKLCFNLLSRLFYRFQYSTTKIQSLTSCIKFHIEMLVSKIDQLPVQIVSPKVKAELTSYYQSRKGHICNLTKYISRLSVMIDRTEPSVQYKENCGENWVHFV